MLSNESVRVGVYFSLFYSGLDLLIHHLSLISLRFSY